MALDVVRKQLEAAVRGYVDSTLRSKMSSKYLHEITITTQDLAVAFQQGTVNVMKAYKFTEKEINLVNANINTVFNWQDVSRSLIREINGFSTVIQGNHELKELKQFYNIQVARGIYVLSKSTSNTLIFRLYNNSKMYTGDVGLTKFTAELRRRAWQLWKKKYLTGSKSQLESYDVESGAKLPKAAAPRIGPLRPQDYNTSATVGGAFGRGAPFAHDSDTAVGTFGLEQIVSDLGDNQDFTASVDTLKTSGITVDVLNSVKKSLSLTFEKETVALPDGTEREYRVVRGSIRKQGKEPGDWTNIKKQILGSKSQKIKGSLPEFLERAQTKIDAMDKATAADAEASEPFSKRAAKRAAEKLVKAALKAEGAKRTKGKAPAKAKNKKEGIKINIGGAGGLSTVATAQLISIAAGASVKARKGKKKSKEETGGSLKLPKLQRDINRSLGAEVRRNMGRPALINRTGQFSNSAELVSLRDTGRTITGEYTYTLTGGGTSKNKSGVYSTFENTGQKQWPTGYNPKPLIAKSIRNLALKYTERKFTLRRV
jgi:hypothetical protein